MSHLVRTRKCRPSHGSDPFREITKIFSVLEAENKQLSEIPKEYRQIALFSNTRQLDSSSQR